MQRFFSIREWKNVPLSNISNNRKNWIFGKLAVRSSKISWSSISACMIINNIDNENMELLDAALFCKTYRQYD